MTDEEILRNAFRDRGESLLYGSYVFGGSSIVGGALLLGEHPVIALATFLAFAGGGIALFVIGRRRGRRASPILETLLERPGEVTQISLYTGEMGTEFTITAPAGEEVVNVMGSDKPLLEVLRRRCPRATVRDRRDP